MGTVQAGSPYYTMIAPSVCLGITKQGLHFEVAWVSLRSSGFRSDEATGAEVLAWGGFAEGPYRSFASHGDWYSSLSSAEDGFTGMGILALVGTLDSPRKHLLFFLE